MQQNFSNGEQLTSGSRIPLETEQTQEPGSEVVGLNFRNTQQRVPMAQQNARASTRRRNFAANTRAAATQLVRRRVENPEEEESPFIDVQELSTYPGSVEIHESTFMAMPVPQGPGEGMEGLSFPSDEASTQFTPNFRNIHMQEGAMTENTLFTEPAEMSEPPSLHPFAAQPQARQQPLPQSTFLTTKKRPHKESLSSFATPINESTRLSETDSILQFAPISISKMSQRREQVVGPNDTRVNLYHSQLSQIMSQHQHEGTHMCSQQAALTAAAAATLREPSGFQLPIQRQLFAPDITATISEEALLNKGQGEPLWKEREVSESEGSHPRQSAQEAASEGAEQSYRISIASSNIFMK